MTPDCFVGRGVERAALEANLREGRSSLLIGGRRAGKTELLGRLRCPGVRIARLDAGGWKLDDEGGALAAFAQALGVPVASRDGVRRALREGPRAGLVVDEADRFLGEAWCPGFLAWLRVLDGTGPDGLGPQVSFVLAGGPVLLGYEDPLERGSPALNNADPVYLSPLSRLEVQQRLERERLDVPLEGVWRRAGGQVWLLDHLCRGLAQGEVLEDAVETALARVEPRFGTWRRQMGEAALRLCLDLPADGVPAAEFRSGGRRFRERGALRVCRYMGLVRHEGEGALARVLPGPSMFLDWLRGAPAEPAWDLAISYATEDEPLARAVKAAVGEAGRVFFAPDEQAWLWGRDLNELLPNTYGVESRRVLVLSTESYAKKRWTGVEFEAALAGGAEVLVVNLGRLPVGYPPDRVWWAGDPASLVGLADALRARLGPPRG